MSRTETARRALLLATLTWGVLEIRPAPAAAVPDYIAAALADPSRPPAQVAADPARRPADVLAFAGIRPGARR